MDLALDRPDRRPGDRRPSWGWIPSTGLGLAIVLGSGSTWTSAGEPTVPDGGVAPKARVATAPPEASGSRRVLDVAPSGRNPANAVATEADPIARARRMIAECRTRYQSVNDYTCTFFKRERIDGQLYDSHVMQMKARSKPSSVYFKFTQPYAGREAIYVQGRNGGKIVAHEVGLGRVVAGTMHLDPKGSMAMEENRHPISEAGVGALIDTVRDRWAMDLTPENSKIVFHENARVGDRPCTLVETIHPRPGPQFLFHKVKLYIDKELDLPIRFEAYDWPSKAGLEPPLMEEYTYMNLRLNVGLKERDFDPNNSQYSYGRF